MLDFFDLETSGLCELGSKLSLSNREAVFLDCRVSKFKSKNQQRKACKLQRKSLLHINYNKELCLSPNDVNTSNTSGMMKTAEICMYLSTGRTKGFNSLFKRCTISLSMVKCTKTSFVFLLMNFVLRVRDETELNLVMDWCLSVYFWRFPLSSCKKH